MLNFDRRAEQLGLKATWLQASRQSDGQMLTKGISAPKPYVRVLMTLVRIRNSADVAPYALVPTPTADKLRAGRAAKSTRLLGVATRLAGTSSCNVKTDEERQHALLSV